jgi:shikimate dehydrogenase
MNLQDAISNRTKEKLYVSLAAKPGTTGTKFYTELFNYYNIDAEYVACTCTDLAGDLQLVREFCNGASITMPYKREVSNYIDWNRSPTSAINTILNKDKLLVGFNCDYLGLNKVLENCIKDKAVVLLGNGAMADNVLALSNNVIQASRANWEQRNTPCDILINTTSIGMGTDESPVEDINSKLVVDCVIGKTKLIELALQKGLSVITGAEIYVAQFIYQFNLYKGITPSIDVVKQIKEKVFV